MALARLNSMQAASRSVYLLEEETASNRSPPCGQNGNSMPNHQLAIYSFFAKATYKNVGYTSLRWQVRVRIMNAYR